MKKQRTQHVVKHSSGGWALKRGSSSRATKIFRTQASAFNFGRKVSMNQKSELMVHGMNGRIRIKNSYGGDAFPPRG